MTFTSDISGTIGVGTSCQAITKSDSTTYSGIRALYVGGAGDVAVKVGSSAATAVTFVGIPAGTILPVNAILVMSTNTTATSIVALF